MTRLVLAVAGVLAVGFLNLLGPRHAGTLALFLSVPIVAVVVILLLIGLPHLGEFRLKPLPGNAWQSWVMLSGMILALSGVETIANLTGVMKLDKGSSMEQPRVEQTARRAIWPVAIEVVVGTALLGWAMISLPHSMEPLLKERWEDMLNVLGEYYSTIALGPELGKVFGIIVGIVVGLLLLSAVNTAIGAPSTFCRPWR